MRKKISIILRRMMIIIFLAVAALFFYLAYQEYKPFQDFRIKEEALNETVITEADDDPINRKIDFETLQNINPEIIGWIYAPQIGADQPILHGEKYLKMDFEGNYSSLGSVFTYDEVDTGLTDSHICLFAHNTRTGQMFGNLKKFRDEEFAAQNNKIYIYTPERSKELQVDTVRRCHKSDEIFQLDWDSGKECQTFTLSTCSGYSGTPYRLTVTFDVTREKIIF